MKPHHILKNFNGSQTGLDFNKFEAGTVADLSDSLAAIAVKEGWAKPVGAGTVLYPNPVLEIMATIQGVQVPDGNLEDDLAEPHVIETKVIEPEETKPAKPLSKMSKAELVAHGLTIGVELVPDNMTVKQMIAAIESARGAE